MPITLTAGEQKQLNVSLEPIPVAKARLYGYVTDVSTGAKIVGATVALSGLHSYSDVTDANGYYEISNIEPGTYNGLVTASGYYDAEF